MASSSPQSGHQTRKFSIANILTPPEPHHRHTGCDSPASTSSSHSPRSSAGKSSGGGAAGSGADEVGLAVPTIPSDVLHAARMHHAAAAAAVRDNPLSALGMLASTLCANGPPDAMAPLPPPSHQQQHMQQLVELQQRHQHAAIVANLLAAQHGVNAPPPMLNPAAAAFLMAATMQQHQYNRCMEGGEPSPPPPMPSLVSPLASSAHQPMSPASSSSAQHAAVGGVYHQAQHAGGRKQRTVYHLWQITVLEKAFQRQQYMVGADREVLAQKLALTETQVRIWFQNRRSKWRKDQREIKPFNIEQANEQREHTRVAVE